MAIKFVRLTCLFSLVWFTAAGQVSAQYPGFARDYWAGKALPLVTEAGAEVPNFQLLADNPHLLGAPTNNVQQGLVNFYAGQNRAGVFVDRIYGSFVADGVAAGYLFWVSANSQAALFVSTALDCGSGWIRIAKSTKRPSPNFRQWTKSAEQKSTPQTMGLGQKYCLQLIRVEDGDGINHAEVRWLTPPNANCPAGCDEGPVLGNKFRTFIFPPPAPASRLTLAWDHSPDFLTGEVDKYWVCWGPSSGNYTTRCKDVGTATTFSSFSDTEIPNGFWCFAVRAERSSILSVFVTGDNLGNEACTLVPTNAVGSALPPEPQEPPAATGLRVVPTPQ
ncbi:MAG: hypothetical protein HYT69_00620 [Candidatus Zambryskibacteria bacterium]|nr:hypothetical protein [Candidatus Zambryskibacteria bacterium]